MLEAKGHAFEWQQIVRDVDDVSTVEVTHNEQRFVLRTETKGVAGKVFQAAGVALPPVLREK